MSTCPSRAFVPSAQPLQQEGRLPELVVAIVVAVETTAEVDDEVVAERGNGEQQSALTDRSGVGGRDRTVEGVAAAVARKRSASVPEGVSHAAACGCA